MSTELLQKRQRYDVKYTNQDPILTAKLVLCCFIIRTSSPNKYSSR